MANGAGVNLLWLAAGEGPRKARGVYIKEANLKVKLWLCPEGHSMTGEMRGTVTWDGDVATCTICGKTSVDEEPEATDV